MLKMKMELAAKRVTTVKQEGLPAGNQVGLRRSAVAAALLLGRREVAEVRKRSER